MKDQNHLLVRTNEKALMAIFSALGSTVRLEVLLDRILEFTIGECGADQGSIILVDETTGDLDILSSRGVPKNVRKVDREKRKSSIAEWVIRHNQPIVLNDMAHTDKFSSVAGNRNIQSAMCVPLRIKSNVIGTININRVERLVLFNDNNLKMAQIMSSQAAVAIENRRLIEKNIEVERLAAIGQTFAGLGHCIKNILSAMGGGSHILDAAIRNSDIEKAARGWDMVKRNNQFLQQLVLDMLTFSKEREPEYDLVDINDMCRSVCRIHLKNAEAKGVAIEFRGNPGLEPVSVDGTGIRRCLMNIVGNAVDACGDPGGTVWVSTDTNASQASDRFVIRIRDNGHGISDEDRTKMFQVFFSTKGAKGTGLGLPVTKKIISEHGGSIDVESEIGKGTTFIITLPKKNLQQMDRQL